ncbi:protein FAR1-related sequence 8-like [Trifolium pratense]|uniref:Protein FAR1-related sequence 8-like n=1 Tax=Trifolium pratense TaxID=57577 RepID=A0A2K3N208_TRIPR|nr:protein FAR1-related sequence 8-like [Trifolium pratense]
MRYVDNALIRQPTAVLLYGDQQLPVDEEIKVGMIFHKKEDCLQAIKSYHIKRSIDFKPKKSDQDRYVIECNQAPQCQFSLRASYSKVNKYWKIVRISNTHTCVSSALTQDHKKLDSNMICDNILSFVEDNVTIEVKALVAHIRDLFNYTISYKKAWIAKNKAIVKIYGDWEDSYNDLPQWLMVMKKWLPGTIIKLQTSPTALDNQVFFQRLFWTFKPCIDGFAFCKPIVQVDGTWLYGKYKGTLLLAVAQDGNNNIFPVAFAIVEGETKEAWNFFMKNLRRYVTPQEGICVISDRHASIKSAYENPSNGWQNPPTSHVYCLRHIGQNFVRETKQSKLRPFVSSMGYAPREPTFRFWRDELMKESVDAVAWVDKIPKEKWTQAFDGGRRWGHMTSILVEAMNSVYKGIRSLPITALVKATYSKSAALFGTRGMDALAVLGSDQVYTKECQLRITEAMTKAQSHIVTRHDRERFAVEETQDPREGRPKGTFKVDLGEKWCDCGRFQSLHMPCSHVIAACFDAHLQYQAYIDDVFKVASVCRVYEHTFEVVQAEMYWPKYEGRKLYPDPSMKRVKKGHPKKSRIRTEMDEFGKKERLCGLCQMPNHNRSNCPNAAGPSS